MDEVIRKRIEEMVKSKKVFLFMKGTPEAPLCGFSAQASGLLGEHGTDFGTFNVLDDEDIRQGVKDYADWPTIPQLYINGEFVGGCDIITEMHHNGELAGILK